MFLRLCLVLLVVFLRTEQFPLLRQKGLLEEGHVAMMAKETLLFGVPHLVAMCEAWLIQSYSVTTRLCECLYISCWCNFLGYSQCACQDIHCVHVGKL